MRLTKYKIRDEIGTGVKSRDSLRINCAVFSFTALSLLVGCGGSTSGIQKVVVTGTVKVDGAPIANGEIRFYPMTGTKGPVSGAAIRDGKYIAQGRGGVPLGEHKVDIRAFRPLKVSGPVDPEGGPVEQFVPPRFNSETTLTARIDESTTVQDFSLSTK
jgi:hypothetical protein